MIMYIVIIIKINCVLFCFVFPMMILKKNILRADIWEFHFMNPSLSVLNVYTNMDLSVRVPEHQRLAFSRLRVISHNLRIETGRWARITRKNRLCPCGLMQTEQHIIENCNLLSNIRECYPGMTFNIDILLNTAEPDMFKVIYDMLNYFS